MVMVRVVMTLVGGIDPSLLEARVSLTLVLAGV